MNRLNKINIHFDYFSKNFLQFESDFYEFSDMDIPLIFFTDDILKNMFSTKRTYFRLNAKNSIDKKDHYFIFSKHECEDNKNEFKYKYVGHRYRIDAW